MQKQLLSKFIKINKWTVYDFVCNRHAQQLVPSAPNELSSVVTGSGIADTVKFEEKRMMSASKTKVIKDGFSSEQVKTALIKMKKQNDSRIWYINLN